MGGHKGENYECGEREVVLQVGAREPLIGERGYAEQKGEPRMHLDLCQDCGERKHEREQSICQRWVSERS